MRERGGMPPFGRLASLILAGDRCVARARDWAASLRSPRRKARGVAVWGPAPAFYQMLRGRTRERLLVQAEKNVDIQGYVRAWLAEVKIPSSVRLTIDIDPISFF